MWKQTIVLVLAGFCLVVVGSEDVSSDRRDRPSHDVHANDFLIRNHHGPPNPTFHNYRPYSQGFQHSPTYHRNHGNFPPNFQHSATFHQSSVDSSPGNVPDRSEEINGRNQGHNSGQDEVGNTYSNSTLTIPLDFIKNISNYSVNDLLLNFVEGSLDDEEDDGPPVFASRFGGDDSEARNAGVVPKKAGCIPEFRTLKLASTEDPSILYIPQCTRVEQCGGCCSHALLSCQPVETETLAYRVIKTQYTSNKKLKILGKEIIPVEKHIKCKCDCKVKAEHCNQYQEYKPDECRCTCKNTDEEQKCYKTGMKKLWNPELCACQCRDVILCTTGFTFDHNECKCTAAPVRRRYAGYDTKGYSSEDVTIVPLGQTDY